MDAAPPAVPRYKLPVAFIPAALKFTAAGVGVIVNGEIMVKSGAVKLIVPVLVKVVSSVSVPVVCVTLMLLLPLLILALIVAVTELMVTAPVVVARSWLNRKMPVPATA